MKIRFGYDLAYFTPSPTHMVLTLLSQPAGTQRLLLPDNLQVEPYVPLQFYIDGFGNPCTRLELAGGFTRLTADGLLEDSGLPELTGPWQEELPVRALASEVLVYLLSSRYCDTENLMSEAWRLFQYVAPGWNRGQAICDSFTATFSSATTMPAPPVPPGKPTPRGAACAATLPTWPLHSVDA
jgi:transglutaminase-like putative cysteine protease